MQQASEQNYSRLPHDILVTICERLDSPSALSSFALCSQSSYVIAVPWLYRKVKLLSTAGQTRFAYAVALQQGKEGLARHVTSLEVPFPDTRSGCVDWHTALLLMTLMRCPAIKSLSLIRPQRDLDAFICTQADINTVSALVSATQNLLDLTINFAPKNSSPYDPIQCYWGKTRYTFSAQNSTIPQEAAPSYKHDHLVFPRPLTDQLARLRSFCLVAGVDLGWKILVHCLGPSLRSLHLSLPLSGDAYLEQVAQTSPYLESFTLNTASSAQVTDTSLSIFAKKCGGTLKRLAISHLNTPEPGNIEPSAQLRPFASLATHCRQLEELHLGEGVPLSVEDLETLLGPSGMPLRTLSLQSAGPVSHFGQKASRERTTQLTSQLVKRLGSTLQDISLAKSVVYANDDFLNACAQLVELQSLDVQLSATVSPSSIDALLSTKPILKSSLCFQGL